ncbi:GNAT family N-acetyltransferase [Nocardioides sp. URHA0032]|uniref:GNAT family N-acetyltransferase n=1 Tax=Nocardioides sp. URHA0032 TaxID=1380388 RepID=UPI0018CC2533|nr:GNAT family N-acetyltransferase [Nocardioides sp. URHA0032]
MRMDDAALLALYDEQVRGTLGIRVPLTWTVEHDGPVTRCVTPREGFAMFTADAGALPAEELEALVDRTFAAFTARGVGFEWKTFDHDRADLVPLLEARGARPEPHEALVLGETRLLAGEPVLPAGLTMRQVNERADLERIAAMESEVWGEDWSWLADDLEERLDSIEVLAVEDGDTVVSAAWLVPLGETDVAGLWGGSTLPAYRGRGIYRALVAARATSALARGCTVLQVDASDDSRPILERLGLRTVGGTTPYAVAALSTPV